MKAFTLIMTLMLGTVALAQDQFGEAISEGDIIASTQVKKAIGNNDHVDLRVTGTIEEVCQMKGCWLTMDIGGGETMRVTFKDYGFFVPKDSNGRTAIIEGVLKKEEQSVETLRHYAEDEGKSKEEIEKITEPVEVLTFVASGVLFKS